MIEENFQMGKSKKAPFFIPKFVNVIVERVEENNVLPPSPPAIRTNPWFLHPSILFVAEASLIGALVEGKGIHWHLLHEEGDLFEGSEVDGFVILSSFKFFFQFFLFHPFFLSLFHHLRFGFGWVQKVNLCMLVPRTLNDDLPPPTVLLEFNSSFLFLFCFESGKCNLRGNMWLWPRVKRKADSRRTSGGGRKGKDDCSGMSESGDAISLVMGSEGRRS